MGVVARVSLDASFEGFSGVIHGGVQALMLDEVMASATHHHTGRYGVTAELVTRYRRAAQTGAELLLHGWVERAEGRRVWVRGRLCEPSGQTITEGKSLYILR